MQHPLADILRAIADGKEIQWRDKDSDYTHWKAYFPSQNEVRLFEQNEYRVKPEQKKYRVALVQTADGIPFASTAQSVEHAIVLEKNKHFVRWLTDWTFYDI